MIPSIVFPLPHLPPIVAKCGCAGPRPGTPSVAGPSPGLSPARPRLGFHPAGPKLAGPNPAGPNPAGPRLAGPNPAGPNPAGPNPAGPRLAGPNVAVGGPRAALPDRVHTSNQKHVKGASTWPSPPIKNVICWTGWVAP